MESGPTRGARETANEWRASPWLAFSVRALVYVVPVSVAYGIIRAVGPWLYRPDGWLGLVAWIAQATLIGALVSRGVGRVTRRMLPLATLLTTTLVFPDRAPSRFGVALRSGTVKQMRKRAHELHRDGLGVTPEEAAENAIVLVTGLGRHDRRTRGHTERVRAYADLIAQEMHLSDEDRNWLAWGVILHDVGKMTVPSEILNKVEKLTDSEWAILKNHPAAGEEMLQPLVPWLGDWVKAAGEHHERWDGRGYPRGLQSSEISLAGRIAAVADAYDVITSKRSYKEPMSAEAARRELVDCAGSQFDPAVVRSFLAVSIGHRPDAGPLAWVTELPLVRGALGALTSPVANVIGAAAIAGSALLGIGDDVAARRTAFAAELDSLRTLPISDDFQTVDRSPGGLDVSPLPTFATTNDNGAVATSTDVVGPPSTSNSTVPDGEPGSTGATGPSSSTGTAPPPPRGTPTTTTTAPPPSTTLPSGSAPSATLPSATVPPTTVPQVTVPQVTVPQVTVPPTTVPQVTVPSVTVPSVTVPSVTVPSVTVPSVTVPSVTVPPVTIPSLVVLPGITTPPITTPPITTPPITTPPITTPPITTPPITTPPITTPPITTPPITTPPITTPTIPGISIGL